MTIPDPSPANGQNSQANSILMRWVTELEQRSREATALLDLNEMLDAASTRFEAAGLVAATLERLFPGWSGSIGCLEDDGETVKVQAAWGIRSPRDDRFQKADCHALDRSLISDGSAGVGTKPCGHLLDGSFASQQLCVPVSVQEEAIGVISLRLLAPKPGEPYLTSPAMTKSRKNLLGIIADQLGVAIRGIDSRESSGGQPRSRELANFHNFVYLEEMLTRELRSSKLAGEPMSVVYFSLEPGYESDGFGLDHNSEKILKKVGALLASSIRKDDSAAVAGPNLFVVVLKNANSDQAMGVVRRILDRITHMSDFENGGAFPVPAIGLAVFPNESNDRINPFAEAERSYQAARAKGPGKIHLSVC